MASPSPAAAPGTAPVRHPASRLALGDALDDHDNALNFVRLLLAVVVILVHAAPIGGFPEMEWQFASGTAVNGFFAISGFLVAGSRTRTSLPGFVWRRALRIYPAFWATLLVTAFLIAPVSGAVGHERWDGDSAVSYVLGNATLHIQQWHIDDLLRSVPYPGAWNGSLWTLEYEGTAYVLCGLLLAVAAIRRRPARWLGGLLLAVLLLQVLACGPLDVTTRRYLEGLRLAGFFVAGMSLWAFRSRVPLTWWLAVPAGCGAAAGQWLPEPWNWTLTALPLAYLVMWLGAVLPTRIAARTDISYGAYIYAFPLQQLLAVLGAGPLLGYWGFCIASLTCTFLVARLSWTMVEKPALRLKHLVP